MLNQTEMLAVIWTLWSIGFLTTFARAILRYNAQGKYEPEDYFAMLAFLFLTALTAVITVLAPIFYMARAYMIAAARDPLTPLPMPLDEMLGRQIMGLKLMFAQMLLFWTTLWAGKFSLLVFFRRLVIGLPKYMRAYWVVFALVLLTYLGCMVSNFLTCRPLTKYWSATGCSDAENVRRADESIKFATGADVAADFLIMLLPLRLLYIVQISRRQKVALASLFSLGIIVIIVAFIRLHHVTRATSSAQVDPTKIADGSILLSLWSQIEAAVAVLVANLPAFRSLLRSGTTVGWRTGAGKYTYQYRYPGTGSRSGGGSGKRKHSVSGSGGRRRNHWGESVSRLSQTQTVTGASLEMQRLPSEESNDGGGLKDADAGAGGIVRTTEFTVYSGRRSSFDRAEYEIPRPGQAFVPK